MVKHARSWFAFMLLLVLVVSPAGAFAAGTPHLVDRRDIKLEGTRIVGLSPDGMKIAAADYDITTLCIYDVASLAKGACADLSPLAAHLRLADVVWSPDSTKLALAERSFEIYRDGDLWVMDAATGELTDLTDDGVNARIPLGDDTKGLDTIYLDVSPTWLPDSSGITFSRSTWVKGSWTGNTIATVALSGGEPVELTRATSDIPGIVYFGMRWSGDGSRLFYSYTGLKKDDPNNGIWVVNADGSGAALLLGSDPERFEPIVAGVSPDGNTVLGYYMRYASNYSSNGPYYALLDVPTGKVTPLDFDQPDAPAYVFIRAAVLSPDGRYVLYATRLTRPDYQVFLRPVDGGPDLSLVPEGLPGATPIDAGAVITWADNGTLLLNSNLNAATLLVIAGVDRPVVTLVPVTTSTEPIPVATPGSGSAEFAAGETVTVNDNDVPLRSAPSTDAQTVMILAKGARLTVIAAPVAAEGFVWVPVSDPATGSLGYVRAEFLSPG